MPADIKDPFFSIQFLVLIVRHRVKMPLLPQRWYKYGVWCHLSQLYVFRLCAHITLTFIILLVLFYNLALNLANLETCLKTPQQSVVFGQTVYFSRAIL